MKRTIIAAGLLAIGAMAASAQWLPPPPPPAPRWAPNLYPYREHHHAVCHEKAFRLHSYERRAVGDGVLTWRERRIISSLRYDLDRTCGRFRWRG